MMSHMAHLSRRSFLAASTAIAAPTRPPDKVAVLTFDDAVKSHRTFVAPLLKEHGFRATFFVSHGFMNLVEHSLTWKEIAEIHQMGFEIGNHSWTHAGFHTPRAAARLEGELALVEYELARVGVPRPTSFAWCGNTFGPEAVDVLRAKGFRFARRGEMPEAPYGQLIVGAAYDPRRHHPLLVPTTGDAYPSWNLEHFKKVVREARDGRIVILQFHGVPDIAHPWVHTPPERFREYMQYLKDEGFRVIALRDLEEFADLAHPPADPLLTVRQPAPKDGKLKLPPEMAATREDLAYWLPNMLSMHRFSLQETAKVCGYGEEEVRGKAEELRVPPPPTTPALRVAPYPGGRHPRIGFLEGAIGPMRGTKASVFLPWDPAAYVVVDLPEAIFCNLGLLFLAHTHIPTIWDQQNKVIDNIDWTRVSGGTLTSRWVLPNQTAFGASIRVEQDHVAMGLELTNGTPEKLEKLRTQVCVMLKGAPGFAALSNANKRFGSSVAAVGDETGRRWILTSWQQAVRTWGNSKVPCLHVDPAFADCEPGRTVRLTGRLWFYEGSDIDAEMQRAGQLLNGGKD
jgi:peptidoglycan/xylan/chitin deacetylase (PgdA/CDA1 family)